MFKRIVNILIVVILFASTTGFTIDRHYCGNKLVSVTFSKSKDCCKMQGCCHHDIKHIKISDSFQISQDNEKIDTSASIFTFLIHGNDQIQSFPFVKIPSFSDPPPLSFLFKDYFLQVFRN